MKPCKKHAVLPPMEAKDEKMHQLIYERNAMQAERDEASPSGVVGVHLEDQRKSLGNSSPGPHAVGYSTRG